MTQPAEGLLASDADRDAAASALAPAQLTRSPAAVAAVTAVQGLPWLLCTGRA